MTRSPIRILATLLAWACLLPGTLPHEGLAATLSTAEIESAIDMAHGAPGEYAADSLLRIASLEQIAPALRIRLIEDAFGRAAEAQQPFRRHSAMQNSPGNSGFLERAFGQELDALSLRSRAVQAMLPLNVGKARELFSEIPPVELPLVACGDFLVYDAARYYDALAAVTERAFTAAEIHDGVQYQFVLQRVAAIGSPAQVAPAIRAILSSGLRDADFSGAAGAITAALRRMAADDRSFTYYLPAVGAEVLALVEECQRRRTPALPLIEAYRLYLVSNFAAARCADGDLSEGGGPGMLGAGGQTIGPRSAEAIRFFNGSIRMAPLQPIEWTEAGPSARVGAASLVRSCESGECRAVAQQYRALVFGSGGTARPSAERDTAEWQDQMQQVLAALADWQDGAADDAAQQFREKCTFYSDLIGLLGEGRGRETALRAMIEYLQRSRGPQLSRMEWLLPVSALIGRVGLAPVGFGRAAEELRHSTDAMIALYAEMERIAPRSAGEIVGLM